MIQKFTLLLHKIANLIKDTIFLQWELLILIHFRKGLVTGGLYGSKDGCQPYVLKPCEHHVNGTRGPCEEDGRTPKCHHYCENKEYNKKYKDDLTHGQKAYSVPETQKDIMVELMTNGPAEGAFTVFADFPNYKSGVYQHVR